MALPAAEREAAKRAYLEERQAEWMARPLAERAAIKLPHAERALALIEGWIVDAPTGQIARSWAGIARMFQQRVARLRGEASPQSDD